MAVIGTISSGIVISLMFWASASAKTIVGDPTVPSFGTGGVRVELIRKPEQVIIVRTPLHRKGPKAVEHLKPSTRMGAADSLELRSGARAPEPRRTGSGDSLNVRSGSDHVDLLPGGDGEEMSL